MIYAVAALLLIAAVHALRSRRRAWAIVLLVAVIPTLAVTIGFVVALVALVAYVGVVAAEARRA